MTTLPEPPLMGWRLWLGRGAWLLAAVLVGLLLSEIWPENPQTTSSEWMVTLARPAVNTFMTYWAFVQVVSVLKSLSAVTALGMALLVVGYKSRDRMGLFVSAFLLLLTPLLLSSNTEVWRLPAWVPFAESLVQLLMVATFGSVVVFAYLFPDGHFVPRWTRWFAFLGLLSIGLLVLTIIIPARVPIRYADSLWLIYSIPWMLSLLVAGLGQVYRYRTQTDRVQRQQMKWVIFGMSAYVVTLLFGFVQNFRENSAWESLVGLLIRLLVVWLIPLTLGASILRYRLWEIDVIIRRTLVYGALSGALLLAYFSSVVLLQTIFQTFTRQASTLAVVASTLTSAVLFNPLRHRIQGSIDRRFFRRKYDAQKTLATFSAALHESHNADLDQLTEELLKVIQETMQPAHVSLWLRDEAPPRSNATSSAQSL